MDWQTFGDLISYQNNGKSDAFIVGKVEQSMSEYSARA
jgi:hypothetical protein